MDTKNNVIITLQRAETQSVTKIWMFWQVRFLVPRHYYECEECNIGGELCPRTYHLKCLNQEMLVKFAPHQQKGWKSWVWGGSEGSFNDVIQEYKLCSGSIN